jgi:ketosteroid isomerase-like protein
MMHHSSRLALAVALAGLSGSLAPAADADVAGVTQAVADFHEALNVMFTGDPAPMKAIWSHEEDIAYMGPMGDHHVGWSEIGPIWDAQAAKKLGGKVGVAELSVIAGPEVGVATYLEKGENIIDGEPRPVSIRTTTSFRKEAGRWKVIGHHTDTLPYLTP